MEIYTPEEIEKIIIFERLYLYNRGEFCGAKAIQSKLKLHNVRPLPSISTIHRILSPNCLTHRRTGYYPKDHNDRDFL